MVRPWRCNAQTTSEVQTVLRLHISTTAQMSLRRCCKKSFRLRRVSSWIEAEMRLTPPRRARRRMAGLVMPWMLSRRISWEVVVLLVERKCRDRLCDAMQCAMFARSPVSFQSAFTKAFAGRPGEATAATFAFAAADGLSPCRTQWSHGRCSGMLISG